MRRLSDTIDRLSTMRGAMARFQPDTDDHRLTDLAYSGTNPGALQGRVYVPENLPDHSALVVVLHGCTQTAAEYDHGSGWSHLAEESGFVLLYPEQQRANNPNLCFNWFTGEDTVRGGGEAMSIREMIATVVRDHAIDPARIFITGLSAGGAMTSVMLATYPELFAGGAIIAGLPYGSASGVLQALDQMRGHGEVDAAELGDAVRRATDHRGPWPTVSIWHGSADATVHTSNRDATVAQWCAVHGVAGTPTTEMIDGVPRHRWQAADGRVVVEEFTIAGMGHGTPLAATGEEACGTVGAYMLEAGISSTRHIAAFWGLTEAVAAESRPAARPATLERILEPAATPPRASANPLKSVGTLIDDALRAAGLMR